MKIGVFATFMSPIANTQMIMDFGRRRRYGLDSVWLGEHVVLFNEMGSLSGLAGWQIPVRKAVVYWRRWQPWGVGCSYHQMRLGTGIALVPQRNPIYTTAPATLDYLTNGRMDLGVGVGWCKEK